MRKITTSNPATGEPLAEYTLHENARVDAILDHAQTAFTNWRRTPMAERAARMQRLSELLKERADELAQIMCREMGKPLKEGRAEANKCAWVCAYYAEHADAFLRNEPIASDAAESYVAFEPLGLVLAIMPWNFPLWQVFRFAAPALMAGNVGVLKHASNVPECALAIEHLFQQAGFIEHVFSTLLIDSDQTQALIDDDRIQAVTLTGSHSAGKAVAARAGAALKKVVLELGGSDPYVILDDADLDHAARICVQSRLINGGQSCIAAKRFIVTEKNRAAFETKVVEEMQKARMGDPTKESTQIGPQARADLRDALHRQVEDSVAQGARCLLGGVIPDGKGAYYPPTVLTDVRRGMPAYEEELFGPVAAIISVADEKEAIVTANDTSFGLGAALFTRDVQKGKRIAEQELQAGCCFVNDFVKSDPRLPFGGIKQSGFGRELSHYGIKEFVNIKTVYISPTTWDEEAQTS